MSLQQILNKPSTNIRKWANITVNDVNSNTADIGKLVVDDIAVNTAEINSLLVNSDLIADSIVASDSIEISGLYIIGSLQSFRNHGYVSDGNQTINLHDNESYMFPKIVDLQGYRINCGAYNTLFGPGLETGGLKSTGLSDTLFLINGNSTLTCHDMAFIADPIRDQNCFNLIASDADNTLDWNHVNFYGWGSSSGENTMIIDGYSNVIWDTLGFIGSSNINFQTTTYSTGTIGIVNTIFQPKTGTNSINIDSSFNCLRRFRTSYSAFISAGGGSTSLNVASDCSIPVNSFILDTCSFSGPGIAIDGINYNDNRALWTNNVGITNTATNGEMIMIGNTSDTIVSNTSDYYHVAGVSIDGDFNQRFSVGLHSDNTLQYTGSISFPVKALISASLNSGNNNQIDIVLRKNGVIVPNSLNTNTTDGGGRLNAINTFGTTLLEQSDWYDVVVRNKSAVNNIRVDKLHVLISSL